MSVIPQPCALLLDLDGVLYHDVTLIPGASQAVQFLRDRRIPFRFVTNTTSKSRAGLVRKLAGMGIPAQAG